MTSPVTCMIPVHELLVVSHSGFMVISKSKSFYNAVLDSNFGPQHRVTEDSHQMMASSLLAQKAPASININQYDVVLSDFFGFDVDEDAFQALKDLIPSHRDASIRLLDLSNNLISDVCAPHISDLVRRGAACISFKGNCFTPEGMKWIMRAIVDCRCVEWLDLRGNPAMEDAQFCSSLIASLPSLKFLRHLGVSFRHKQSTQALVRSLISVEKRPACFVSLDLGGSVVSVECALDISNLIKHDGLFHLSLAGCLLGSAIKRLLPAIRGSRQLVSLDLRWNCLGTLTVRDICEALFINESIIHLNISANELRDPILYKLSELLEEKETLRTVDISKNDFTPVGAARLIEAMYKNVTLLSLGDLEFTNYGLGLANRKTLQRLLNENYTGVQDKISWKIVENSTRPQIWSCLMKDKSEQE